MHLDIPTSGLLPVFHCGCWRSDDDDDDGVPLDRQRPANYHANAGSIEFTESKSFASAGKIAKREKERERDRKRRGNAW